MYRYTTPTIPITIEDLDFADVSLFRVAIEQDEVEMLKIIDVDSASVDAEHRTIYVPLTQEETSSFKDGTAVVQVRVVFASGAVQATKKAPLTVRDVLDEVII